MGADAHLAVALVDDDEAILESLSYYLSRRGLDVRTAQSGSELDDILQQVVIDVVVLDLMMPEEDGLSICRRLGDEHAIIMLSAIGDVTDRVIGLELGACDYLVKPFDPRELLARIRSAARRSAIARQRQRRLLFSFEQWILDVDDMRLTDATGNEVSLSAGELHLLHVFVDRPRRLLTREFLLSATQGSGADAFDRSIDVTVSRLRRKLHRQGEPSLIETVRGEGYRFSAMVKRF